MLRSKNCNTVHLHSCNLYTRSQEASSRSPQITPSALSQSLSCERQPFKDNLELSSSTPTSIAFQSKATSKGISAKAATQTLTSTSHRNPSFTHSAGKLPKPQRMGCQGNVIEAVDANIVWKLCDTKN